MNFLPNESLILDYKDFNFILTTHRIRYQDESFSSTEIKSIMLEELSACTLSRNTYIIFLIIAGIFLLFGVLLAAILSLIWILIIGIFVSLAFVFVYFATREQVLVLSSNGTNITLNTGKMKLEKVKEIVDQTELAKNARYFKMSGLRT